MSTYRKWAVIGLDPLTIKPVDIRTDEEKEDIAEAEADPNFIKWDEL